MSSMNVLVIGMSGGIIASEICSARTVCVCVCVFINHNLAIT